MTALPWNSDRGGLPQLFRIDDIVQVRQDGSAPHDWSGKWARVPLRIVGTLKDEHRPGRVCYFVLAEGEKTREHDPMAEDWLEAAALTAPDHPAPHSGKSHA